MSSFYHPRNETGRFLNLRLEKYFDESHEPGGDWGEISLHFPQTFLSTLHFRRHYIFVNIAFSSTPFSSTGKDKPGWMERIARTARIARIAGKVPSSDFRAAVLSRLVGFCLREIC